MTIVEEMGCKANQVKLEGMTLKLQEILKKLEVLDNRLVAVESRSRERKGREESTADEEEGESAGVVNRMDGMGKSGKQFGAIDKELQIAQLEKLREESNFFSYVDSFVSIASQLELSEEEEVALFVEGLKKDNTKLITILNPKTLQQAIAFGKVLTSDEDPYRTREKALQQGVKEAQVANEEQEDSRQLLEAASEFANYPRVQNDAAAREFLDRFSLPVIISALQTGANVADYIPFVVVGLKAASPEVRSLSCKIVSCLLAICDDMSASAIKLIVDNNVYPLLLDCLINGDERVAAASMDTIKTLTCFQEGVGVVFPADDTAPTHLGNLAAQCTSLGRVRVLALIVKLFSVSISVASTIYNCNLRNFMEAEIRAPKDNIVTLSVLELLYEMAEIQHGTKSLSRTSLLQLLSSIINNELMESILRTRAIMICGRLLRRDAIYIILDESSIRMIIAAINGRLMQSESLDPNECESLVEALGQIGLSAKGAVLLLPGPSIVAKYLVNAAFDKKGRGRQLTALHALVNSLPICISLLDLKRLAIGIHQLNHGTAVSVHPEIVESMLGSLGDLLKLLDVSSSEKTKKKAGGDGAEEEFGEFLHLSGNFDFSKIWREIQAKTEREAGGNKGVSDKQILLKIFYPNVLDIPLVDLPGLTKVSIGDQPSDIEARIRTMIMSYIKVPSCLILAVTPANFDLANSYALQMAEMVDPDGHRTIGVITKLDIMDRGTDARNLLLGKVIPLRLGYVGVVNRSQEDIMLNRSIKDALIAEEKFFRSGPVYNGLADRCGVSQLAKKLNQIIVQHIKSVLPVLKSRIASTLTVVAKEYASYGNVIEKNALGAVLFNILSKYTKAFSSMVEGKNYEMSTSERSGGARIHYIFPSIFDRSLEEVDPCEDLTDEDIRTAIQNANDPKSASWEFLFDLQTKYPNYTLEDKGVSEERVLMRGNGFGCMGMTLKGVEGATIEKQGSCNRISYDRQLKVKKEGNRQTRVINKQE